MIRNRLSEIMGARRLKQAEVARGAGLLPKTVNKFYNDENDSFDRDVLDRLCAYLGVDVCELLVYAPDPAPADEPDGAGELAGAEG
jgi:putative transcriptional regulator